MVAADPFPDAVEDHPSHVTVTFHREPFPPAALDRLRAVHDGPEDLSVVARELFIDFGGREGVRESKLVTTMRKAKLPAVATGTQSSSSLRCFSQEIERCGEPLGGMRSADEGAPDPPSAIQPTGSSSHFSNSSMSISRPLLPVSIGA